MKISFLNHFPVRANLVRNISPENIVIRENMVISNSLPNDKLLDWSKLKAFAANNKKCDLEIEVCF